MCVLQKLKMKKKNKKNTDALNCLKIKEKTIPKKKNEEKKRCRFTN